MNSAKVYSDGPHGIINSGGNVTIAGGSIELKRTTTGTALISSGGHMSMSAGEIVSSGYGFVVKGGSAQTTGGSISSNSSNAGVYTVALMENAVTLDLNSTKVIRTGASTLAVGNMKSNPQYGELIIRSRDSNYGVTGNCSFGVVATTNTTPGQSSERVTIYNGGSTIYRFPTWTANNGQDDIDWMESYSDSGTHTVTIYKSKHKNETGVYHVHFYKVADNSEEFQQQGVGGMELVF